MSKGARWAWVTLAGAVLLSGCMEGTFPRHGMRPRGNVATYRDALEARLLKKYNAMPAWHDKVSRVELVLPRPPERSVDGELVRVEFTQIVYDRWGERIPELEEEYYTVTFGKAETHTVRAEPTVRVGLDAESDFGTGEPVPVVRPRGGAAPEEDAARPPSPGRGVPSEVARTAPVFHSRPPSSTPGRYEGPAATTAARPVRPGAGQSLMVGPGSTGRVGRPYRNAGAARWGSASAAGPSAAGAEPAAVRERRSRRVPEAASSVTPARSRIPVTTPDRGGERGAPPVTPEEFSRLLRGDDPALPQEPYRAMRAPAGTGSDLPRSGLRGLDTWSGGPEIE